ncbi:MAG: hypothetical protein WC595_03905 [Candidatus Nanoarchaeia archaeon]
MADSRRVEANAVIAVDLISYESAAERFGVALDNLYLRERMRVSAPVPKSVGFTRIVQSELREGKCLEWTFNYEVLQDEV